MTTFLFWWSIISTIVGIISLIFNAGQVVAYIKEKSLILKEKEIHKSQVKVWQHHANGIQMGLFILTMGKFSSVTDILEATKALHQTAQSLYQSLNEERLFTDAEIKEKQIQKENESQSRLKLAEQQRQVEMPKQV
jgi:hypothetical protein